MDKIQRIGYYGSKYKYLLALFLFLLVGGILGNNSLYRYFELSTENERLREEIAEYEARIAAYRQQKKILETDPTAVEEIARVRLNMKKENEDMYVVESISTDSLSQ